jgi:hypothetical protein
MNHGLLKSPSLLWTVITFGLLAMVMFWGRGERIGERIQNEAEG